MIPVAHATGRDISPSGLEELSYHVSPSGLEELIDHVSPAGLWDILP